MIAVFRHTTFKTVSTVLLLYAFLSPFAIQLEHIIHEHEDHKGYQNKTECHFYSNDSDCNCLDYKAYQDGFTNNFVILNFYADSYAIHNFALNNSFLQKQIFTSQLRAPPSLL